MLLCIFVICFWYNLLFYNSPVTSERRLRDMINQRFLHMRLCYFSAVKLREPRVNVASRQATARVITRRKKEFSVASVQGNRSENSEYVKFIHGRTFRLVATLRSVSKEIRRFTNEFRMMLRGSSSLAGILNEVRCSINFLIHTLQQTKFDPTHLLEL